ncbi:MAG: NUDIX domain-containing protein [Desulfarculaceae bacterium]
MIEPKYCQVCGSPLSQNVKDAQGGPPFICADCGMPVYLDPKVAVAVVVESDSGVVLIKRAQKDLAHGRWILPGGHVDRGEVVPEAAVREVSEETGLRIKLKRLLGVYSYPGNPVVLIVYLAQSNGGSLRPGKEALEIATFEPQKIPWDSLGYQSTGQALQDYLACRSPKAV